MSKLATKTSLGFANLVLLLAIVLFAPAWTFGFWQAWLYLFLFASSSAAITIYLWKRDRALLAHRVSAGPIAEKSRTQQIIQLFASLGFLAILVAPSRPVGCGVLMRANLPSLPDVTGNGWIEWETNQNRLVYLVGLRDLKKQFFRGLLVIGPIEQDHTIRPGARLKPCRA